jgi:hypothetical protein
MRPVGFELAIPASERPQTHALDRAAGGIDPKYSIVSKIFKGIFFEYCVRCGGVRGDWMELAQDWDRWRALVGTVRDFRVPQMRGIS